MTLKHPLVSVVMPVYNSEKYLAGAIESILHQTYTHFEFIIIDDGSTDSSRKIIKSFQDKRIILINHKENRGIVRSLNDGINHAKGKYLARMDSDDFSNPRRFEVQIQLMEQKTKIGVCATNIQTINGQGKIISKPWHSPHRAPIEWELMWENIIPHPSVMIRTAILNEIKGPYRKVDLAEDYDLWLRLLGRTVFFCIDSVLLYYRRHSDNNTNAANSESQVNAYILNTKYISTRLQLAIPREHAFLTRIDNDVRIQPKIIDLKKWMITLWGKLTVGNVIDDGVPFPTNLITTQIIFASSKLRLSGKIKLAIDAFNQKDIWLSVRLFLKAITGSIGNTVIVCMQHHKRWTTNFLRK